MDLLGSVSPSNYLYIYILIYSKYYIYIGNLKKKQIKLDGGFQPFLFGVGRSTFQAMAAKIQAVKAQGFLDGKSGTVEFHS